MPERKVKVKKILRGETATRIENVPSLDCEGCPMAWMRKLIPMGVVCLAKPYGCDAYLAMRNYHERIFTCDMCGRHYTRPDQKEDNYDSGELNICCDACAWKVSHEEGEPKPEHTCGISMVNI